MSTKNTSVISKGLKAQPVTGEQIEHIMDMWRRRLRSRKLTLEEGNYLIRNRGHYHPTMDKAVDVLVDQVRSDMQDTIVRMVYNIRRNRSAEQTINDTGRNKYVTDSVIATMPVGKGPEEVELTYRRLGRYMTAEELDNFMVGYKIDPQAQAADAEADPKFVDSHPSVSQWDRYGKVSSYLAFGMWFDKRDVDCRRDDYKFLRNFWACGVHI